MSVSVERSSVMPSQQSDPPRLNGRFRVEAELARGGMGAVFSAVDIATGQRVALKRLVADAPPRASALFEREFYVLASLKHPRIIDVHDYCVDAAGPYYTMELLEGSDLREISPVAPAIACRYLRDVASSLALLHARRLLHRDVSPRNVRTLPGGGCKLIDFGALTSFGTSEDLVGTPPAIPPEALSGNPMDQRADLFALGALAYFLLTGRHAYQARKVSELPELWREPIAPPSRFAPDVPAGLDQLVLALLSLDELARPSSAAEVIDLLQAIGGLEPDHDDQAARAYFVGAALVERRPELDRVARRLTRARSARGGGIYVDANPGVGKTRFLAETTLRAQLGGTLVLRTDALSHSGAFSVARALAQQLVRLAPKIAAKTLGRREDVLGFVWPEMFVELDLQSRTPERAETNAPPDLPGVLEACFSGIAKLVPLLLAVDNVDRADLESVALLLALARAGRNGRLVVLTTAGVRPVAELSAAVRALRESGATIRLRELSAEGVTELVDTAFGNAVHGRRTAMRLFTATGGNPGRCMRLLQSFVDEGLIRYDAGTWSLPLDIPAANLARAERVVGDRLQTLSVDARWSAAILAVRNQPTLLDWLVTFDEGARSSRQIIAAMEELVGAEILVEGPEGYWFSDDGYRAAARADAEDDAVSGIEVRIGEALLARASNPSQRMIAGLHFIRGSQRGRGADLVAKAARVVVASDANAGRTLSTVSDALEAALGVYRSERRGNLELCGLLVPLAIASYEVSLSFANTYGEETVVRLERALGLPSSVEKTDHSPDLETLMAALSKAPVLDVGEKKAEDCPDVVTLVSWLISTAISLTAVGSAVIDHVAEERYARALLPFTAFGPTHPASFAYDFCRLIVSMTEDRFAISHAGWTAMLSRLERVPLPEQLRRRLTRGALYALGILETQQDHSAALGRIQQLEALGGEQSMAIANQLRFLYHGFRGELEVAQRYRDRVEEYAIRYGSAWQVEIWSTSTALAVYGNCRDVSGTKRVLEQLERLKNAAPSLELYWERALASQYALTGAHDRAVELIERMLARPFARERVGWSSVRGLLAREYNDLGNHALAKRICDETLPQCRDDFEFVTMTLRVRIELARAMTGLGDYAGANTYLSELLSQYLPNENPATLAAIYRAFAELAHAEDDKASLEQHLASMRRWVLPTKNPALIGQCDALRGSTWASGAWTTAQPASTVLAGTSMTFVQSVFATCEGEHARKQRALELAASQTGARDAWLFTIGANGDPVVAGRLGIAEAPGDLIEQVKDMFDEVLDDAEETAFVAATDAATLAAQKSAQYRLFPLVVNHGEKRVLVGAIAMPMVGAARPISHELLQDIATQLFQSGDVAIVRTFF